METKIQMNKTVSTNKLEQLKSLSGAYVWIDDPNAKITLFHKILKLWMTLKCNKNSFRE